MHMYVIARAEKDRLKRWMNDLSACYMQYEYEKGKVGHLQLGVREVKLLEFAFPEKHLDHVLSIVKPKSPNMKKTSRFLAKLLGLIPIKSKFTQSMFPIKTHVDVIPIGLKKDKFEDGVELI